MKEMPTVELSSEVSAQQKTARLFKRKLKIAMDNDNKLKNNVYTVKH